MYTDELRRHRRALHRMPELMFDLPQTQEYILNALKGYGCEITTVGAGVIAFFDAGKKATVGYRADMDALPVNEATNAEYASQCPGRMHACGHDGHMAMLLTFAGWVNEHIGALNRNVLLMFQPAEESGGGGKMIAESGCLEKYNVDRVFAIHVEPDLPVGAASSRPGPFFAHASEIHLDITGRAGHAAVPGAGLDALAAAAEFVTCAYARAKDIPHEEPRRFIFCQLTAGNCTNIIAPNAQVKGTMRTYSKRDAQALREMLHSLADEMDAKFGTTHTLNIHDGYPALYNNAELYEKADAAIGLIRIPEPVFLGEDFSFYAEKVPSLMVKIGLGTGIPLHSPTFDFDESALENGVEFYIKMAEME